MLLLQQASHDAEKHLIFHINYCTAIKTFPDMFISEGVLLLGNREFKKNHNRNGNGKATKQKV